MNWTVFTSAFLGSSVVAALVAALVSLRVSERQIAIENVTKERTKWREKIRRIAIDVHKGVDAKESDKLFLLHTELALSLNPEDDEDHAILLCLTRLATDGSASDGIDEFKHRIALLLKHDWERAKREARPVWCRIHKNPERTAFAESKYGSSTANRVAVNPPSR